MLITSFLLIVIMMLIIAQIEMIIVGIFTTIANIYKTINIMISISVVYVQICRSENYNGYLKMLLKSNRIT